MNVSVAVPLFITSGAAALALMLGLLPGARIRRSGPNAVAGVGIAAALVVCVAQWGDRRVGYAGNLYGDRFALLVEMLVLVAAGAVIALSLREPAATDRRGEYVALILLSATGMMMTAAAGDIITMFIGIELLSVALYVLCALEVWRTRSLESGLKYLIIGSVGSAIFLYGLALLYGASGQTQLGEIGRALGDVTLTSDPMVTGALALIVAGLGFKASAVPFHMWTPDVYEGAPTPVTAFMATATKVAAIAAFLRILFGTLPSAAPDWRIAVAVVAALTMIVGNVAALVQTNVKRMLAYSGVAQAGYLLIGVAAGSVQGARAALYYLAVYVVMTLAIFAVVIIRERETEHGDDIASYRGYARRRPALGIAATLALLSLAGFPPLSGFIGKFLLFGAAADQDLAWLAVVGAVGSAISLGYYLRLLGTMWLDNTDDSGRPLRAIPGATALVAFGSAAAVVALSLAAGPVLSAVQGAAEALIAP